MHKDAVQAAKKHEAALILFFWTSKRESPAIFDGEFLS
jgi:hypothetical protein